MANHPKRAKVVHSIKGFDHNLQCRGYQFEIGKTYTHDGEVVACSSGFHAVEYPLDVLQYYAPAESRYCEVVQAGKLARHDGDTKIASAKITIGVEIGLSDLIQRAVKWVMDRAIPEEGSQAIGYSGAASAIGYSGAASATGDSGAASATGDSGAASATGTRGAASATGDSGAASATGYSGAASATGDSGAAMASGIYGRVMGAEGCALFLVWRDLNSREIIHAWAGIAGRNGIKPLTWYSLNESGEPVEA